MPRDFYEILEVERTADDQTIKASWRKLAMKHHPDRNPGSAEAETEIRDINEAFEILKDPQKRAAYDRFGHAAFEVSGSSGSSDFENIFASIFGGWGSPGDRRRPDPPPDPHAQLFRNFNSYTHESDADALLAVLNADTQLAAHFLSKISAYKLQKTGGEKLRVRLAELAPEAYSNAMAAIEIQSFNDSPYDRPANALVASLGEYPQLADRYVREISVKSLRSEAGVNLRARLAEAVPLAYRDKMLPHCIQSFNGYPWAEDANVLLELLAQDPKLAERYLHDIIPSSLAKDSGRRVEAELARLRPKAYRDKMVPEYITRFNRECEKEDAAALLELLDRNPQLASQYLRDINAGAFTSWRAGEVSKKLSTRLAELEPQAYRDKMVPHFIKLLNGQSSEKETATILLALLEQDPQLAGQYLRDINPSSLAHAGDALNVRLEALEPQAYRDAMVPEHLRRLNGFGLESAADILVRFLDQDTSLAERYIAEIDSRVWDRREARSLRAKSAELAPQAYLEREVGTAIRNFNFFPAEHSAADLLRFLGQEPSLLDQYRREIKPESLDHRYGAALKTKLTELASASPAEGEASRPEDSGTSLALLAKKM